MAFTTDQSVGSGGFSGRPFQWQEDRDINSQVNVGRVERWMSLLAGAALAAYAIKRRTPASGAAVISGAALMYRGATGHCDVYERLGINRAEHRAFERGTGVIADRHSDTRRKLGGGRGTHVVEAVTVRRPIADVYRFWRDFENLPRFMRHLESVAMREEGVSHWVAKGPAGVPVEWDARIINEVDNKVIGWQSLEGSTIATAGSVHFDETADGTVVRVTSPVQPAGGKLGSAVAWMFGEEPGQQVREDLQRFKALLESPAQAGNQILP